MKNQSLLKQEIPLSLVLLSLLWTTRSGVVGSHFGSALNLPDASWAVFWLLGFWVRQVRWLIAGFVASGNADYFAVQHGTSADCFTTAYIFLIPSYLSLWVAGRWAQRQSLFEDSTGATHVLSLLVGVFACFTCANIGMYLASDTVNQLSLWNYTLTVAHYLPLYLATSTLYVSVGLLIAYVIKQIRLLSNSSQRV